MTDAQAMTVASNPSFRDRIRYHLTGAAVAVMAEAADTAGHAKRVAFAGEVLANTADFTAAAVAVMTNATLKAKTLDQADATLGVPESDLPFTVASVFNALAGVSL